MFIVNKISALIIALATACVFTSCGEIKRGEYAKGSAFIVCDDGFRNVLREEIEVFEYQYPESFIIPVYLSEQQALDSLLAGKAPLAITTRELTKEEIRYLKDKHRKITRQNCIAVDAVAIIVNKDNPVDLLTMNEIRDILTGKISTWAQLAVPDTSKIRIVFDNPGSSTVSYMRNKFLPEGAMISDNPNAYAQKSNQDVFDLVKTDRNALGIISVSWLGSELTDTKMPVKERLEDLQTENDTVAVEFTDAIKVLKVRGGEDPMGYKPYQAYINDGRYPLFRKVYIICTGSNSTVSHSFFAFLTGFIGQKIISRTGIMPYNVQPRVVQLR